VLGWGDAEKDVGLEDGGRKVAGDLDVGGQGEARKVGQIFAGIA
jgi:hypothetical protein